MGEYHERYEVGGQITADPSEAAMLAERADAGRGENLTPIITRNAYTDQEIDRQTRAEFVKMHGLDDPATEDIWEFTERSRSRWPAIVDLWHWSTNYDAGKGPFALFVDLIGWSADELGSAVWGGYESLGAGGAYHMSHDSSRYLGYVELEKLADALAEYVKQPQDARRFVDELMSIEGS